MIPFFFPDTVAATSHAADAKPSESSLRSVFFRVGAGIGTVAHSEQTDLLNEAGGYGGPRWWVHGDVGWFFSRYVGLGAWAAASYRVSQQDHVPTLKEYGRFAGGAVHVRHVLSDGVWLIGGVKLGYGEGASELHGHGEWQGALAYGVDVGMIAPTKVPLGFSLGYLHAPSRAISDVARDANFGGFFFWLSGVIRG
jgi:hypothetical protein